MSSESTTLVNVEFEKKKFVVSINGRIATFMSHDSQDFKVLDNILDGHHFCGITSEGKTITFDVGIQKSKTREMMSGFVSYRFPVTKVLWHKGMFHNHFIDHFDEISFHGELLDYLHLPSNMLEIPDAELEQTNAFKLEEKGIFISYGWQKIKSGSHGDLGSWKTFLKLKFDEPQEITEINNHYFAMTRLCQFLVGRLNVRFDNIKIFKRAPMYDSQKTVESMINLEHNGEKDLYRTDADGNVILFLQDAADCEIKVSHFDYADLKSFKNIPLTLLNEHLTALIPLFYNMDTSRKKNDAHLLSLLPTTNREMGYLRYVQIKDLCTGLEIEYDRLDNAEKLDEPVLKNVREHLQDCLKKYAEEQGIESTLEQQINGSLNHIGLNARNKIFHLRNKIELEINENGFSITDDEIGLLIRNRNNLTHGGWMKDEPIASVYKKLEILFYLVVFMRIGVRDGKLKELYFQLINRS